jgi:hypothetical protein
MDAPRPNADAAPASGLAGYTAVVCAGVRCEKGADDLLDALRPLVRQHRYCVLIRAGCVLGVPTCRARGGGPLVCVQPCWSDRRPVGAPVLLGPVRTGADVQAVCQWLRSADLDPGTVPERFRQPLRAPASSN